MKMNIEINESHMLQMKDIQLHKESVKFLREVFKQYEDANLRNDTVINNPIIHLYAEEDTMNSNGDLNGYSDSLFCKVYVYDPKKGLKYYAGTCDSVDVGDTGIWQVKIFKDGSTLMMFSGEYTFGRTTTLTIFKV